MASLRLHKITKIYEKDVLAAKDITFCVADKEFSVLVGPSGCGKTTVLRLIAGLESITSGEIFIDDQCVNELSPKERDIAMVFQNYALYPHMTAFENIAFGLKMRKYPRQEIEQRVTETAEILGIEKLLQRQPRHLSGGERQRVAVGRAIVRQPKLFLFDEPLSNLDAKLRVQMRAELSRLHKRFQTTIVYVTHDQVEAMTLGEKIIVIKDGEVQQSADPRTLYRNPENRFVASFIGSPPMNFLQGSIIRKNGAFQFQNKDMTIPVPEKMGQYHDREIVIGVRPGDLTVQNDAHLDITIDVTEPLGDDLYVHGRCGSTMICARLPEGIYPEIGDRIPLMVNLSRLYYFDAKTEKAIH